MTQDQTEHHDLEAMSQVDADAYFDDAEEAEIRLQEIERDKLTRQWAEEAHEQMFDDDSLMPTAEECEEIAARYGL